MDANDLLHDENRMNINDTIKAQVWEFQQIWVPIKASERVTLNLTVSFHFLKKGGRGWECAWHYLMHLMHVVSIKIKWENLCKWLLWCLAHRRRLMPNLFILSSSISACVKKAEQKQAISTTKLFISILLTIYFNPSHSHITNPVLILSEFLLQLFFFLDSL